MHIPSTTDDAPDQDGRTPVEHLTDIIHGLREIEALASANLARAYVSLWEMELQDASAAGLPSGRRIYCEKVLSRAKTDLIAAEATLALFAGDRP